MITNSRSNNTQSRPAAFLWDESFFWGVMAYKALLANGLSFDPIRAEDVKNDRLRDYRLLFVPGGWASNKMKALGDDGAAAIRRFVHDGGAYLGLCGGAGLATMDGIGLLPVKRRPTKERVPSFSGRIMLNTSGHPAWQGISKTVFHAWWPSQFVADERVSVLARYGTAMPDSFSSDINVGDAEAHGGWEDHERIYQINLDPKRLYGEPAVIEGLSGAGKVVLSLVHFDTPNDGNGAAMLRNLWHYLIPDYDCRLAIPDSESRYEKIPGEDRRAVQSKIMVPVEAAVCSVIDLGLRNFLWFWRSPMLLQWRRGVRGLEYCTLFILIKEIADLLKCVDHGDGNLVPDLDRMSRLLLPFVDKAKHLLALERFAIQNSNISYERCDDPKIQALREELFSRSKSHGGLFKELVDAIDAILYKLLREEIVPAERS